MSRPPLEVEALLMPHEVAAMFRVDVKTVTRWANAGRLGFIRTLGQHRRYKRDEVLALLEQKDTACVCGCDRFGHVEATVGNVRRRMGCRRHHISCVEFTPVGAR